MTPLPATPDPVDLAARYAAKACHRSFEANPMLWRDVGAVLLAALMEPDATAENVLASSRGPDAPCGPISAPGAASDAETVPGCGRQQRPLSGAL